MLKLGIASIQLSSFSYRLVFFTSTWSKYWISMTINPVTIFSTKFWGFNWAGLHQNFPCFTWAWVGWIYFDTDWMDWSNLHRNPSGLGWTGNFLGGYWRPQWALSVLLVWIMAPPRKALLCWIIQCVYHICCRLYDCWSNGHFHGVYFSGSANGVSVGRIRVYWIHFTDDKFPNQFIEILCTEFQFIESSSPKICSQIRWPKPVYLIQIPELVNQNLLLHLSQLCIE